MARLGTFSYVLVVYLVTLGESFQPNFLFILLDDLGWNDVGYHGSTYVSTPNIDALARSGTLLERHYSDIFCSSSRAALLTGKYPHRYGVNYVIQPDDDFGLPVEEVLLPEYLKDLGYVSHLVGKWHLGYLEEEWLPTNRGFETFFGAYTSGTDYTTHNMKLKGECDIYDFHFVNETGEFDMSDYEGDYITDLNKERVFELLDQFSNGDSPFFLYYATQGLHTPLDPPNEYLEDFPTIENQYRQSYLGQVKAEDEAIGAILEKLNETGLLDSTFIVVTSDNGGDSAYSSTYPLRGSKKNAMEGGIRVPTFIAGYGVTSETTLNNMMHLTDWLPTLYFAAGGSLDDLIGPIDGINQWDVLMLTDSTFPRNELYSMTNYTTDAGSTVSQKTIIRGHYKYLETSANPELHPDALWNWYSDTENSDEDRNYYIDDWKIPVVDCVNVTRTPCTEVNDIFVCLFDLKSDPCEFDNLYDSQPALRTLMALALREYENGEVVLEYGDIDICEVLEW